MYTYTYTTLRNFRVLYKMVAVYLPLQGRASTVSVY